MGLFELLVLFWFSWSISFTCPDTMGVFNMSEKEFTKITLEWRDLSNKILNSTNKEIIIKWEGVGGALGIMQSFRETLEKAKAAGKHITFVITGPAMSAHAFLVCQADTIIFENDDSVLMFHPISGVDNKILTDVNSQQWLRTLLQPCVNKGILTAKALEASIKSHEVYVGRKDNKVATLWIPDARLKHKRVK